MGEDSPVANPEGPRFALDGQRRSRWDEVMHSAEPSVGLPIILILFIGLIALVYFGLWIWSLIHCVQNRYLNDNNRLIGILLIILLGLIGSLVYLFLPRESEPQR